MPDTGPCIVRAVSSVSEIQQLALDPELRRQSVDVVRLHHSLQHRQLEVSRETPPPSSLRHICSPAITVCLIIVSQFRGALHHDGFDRRSSAFIGGSKSFAADLTAKAYESLGPRVEYQVGLGSPAVQPAGLRACAPSSGWVNRNCRKAFSVSLTSSGRSVLQSRSGVTVITTGIKRAPIRLSRAMPARIARPRRAGSPSVHMATAVTKAGCALVMMRHVGRAPAVPCSQLSALSSAFGGRLRRRRSARTGAAVLRGEKVSVVTSSSKSPHVTRCVATRPGAV